MPAVSGAPPGARETVRRQALEPYLLRVRAWLDEGAAAPLHLAGRKLAADPWIRERALAPGDGPGPVLCQALALLLKVAEDTSVLEAAAPPARDELYRAQAELMLDAAMGMALSRELQRAVDDAVRRGHIEPAKRLSRFHHDLRHAVGAAKARIAESERARAETLTDSLTDQPREAGAADDTLDRAARETAARVEIAERSRRTRLVSLKRALLPARTDLLLGLLAISAVAWLFVVKLPARVGVAPPRPLTLKELADPAILRVEARPPSLYVELASRVWTRYEEAERRGLLERASVILLTGGYAGALFRTDDGRPVARWLSDRGIELIRPAAPRAPAEGWGTAPEATPPPSTAEPVSPAPDPPEAEDESP